MKLKESIDHKSNGSSNTSNCNIGQLKLEKSLESGSQLPASRLGRQKRNTINLAKLSMVLKNTGAMGSASLANDSAGQGNLPGSFAQFQKEDFNSIANILNATLSKLKRPNKHFLTPLDKSVLKAS